MSRLSLIGMRLSVLFFFFSFFSFPFFSFSFSFFFPPVSDSGALSCLN